MFNVMARRICSVSYKLCSECSQCSMLHATVPTINMQNWENLVPTNIMFALSSMKENKIPLQPHCIRNNTESTFIHASTSVFLFQAWWVVVGAVRSEHYTQNMSNKCKQTFMVTSAPAGVQSTAA